MNYYQFHIADWALHTSHLTLEEEGVYRRLLDHYYDTESPIPEETQPVIRRLRLRGYEEIVGLILEEFFTLEADGWHNRRADKEIEAYQQKAEQARANGRKGGRPKKNKGLAESKPRETQPVISGMQEKSGSKANQEPRTINQEPIKDLASSPAGEDTGPNDPPEISVDETPSTKKPPAGEPRFIAKHAELPPGVDPANWQRWCEYRSSKRKPISRHAARQQVALLAEQPPDVQRAMVQQSIQNDYQGLFVPRGASHAAGQPGRKPVSEIDRVNEAISRRAQEREAVLSGQWPASDGRGDFLETDVGVVRLPVHTTVRR